jgi:hypothetical protein
MIAEEWAQLPGWPYEVSTEGQDRRGDKPVKVSYAAGKYPKFTGSRPGQRKTIYLPDAMWTAHVEPTDLGRVTFADGNPKNVVLSMAKSKSPLVAG